MNKYLKEVEEEIKKLASCKYKMSNDKFGVPRSVGVSSCKLKPRLKTGFSFSDKTDDEQWKIWNFIYKNSKLHEAQMAALRFAEDRIESNGPQEWQILKHWVEHVDNWAHSDVLSKVYSFLLESNPSILLPTLKKWNTSTNPWKRRASVVSTIYYSSKNRTAPPLKLVLGLIESLIKDEDMYVQKGVGWQLRECYNLDPKNTLKFIERHLLELPATAFSYATEKVPKNIKEKMKEKRKQARSKK